MKKILILIPLFYLSSTSVFSAYQSGENQASTPYVEILTNPYADKLSVYFSFGCFHCMKFMSKNIGGIKQQLKKQKLNIELLEISGMMPYRENRMIEAKRMSKLATIYTQCIADRKGGYAYIDAIEKIVLLAKKSIKVIEIRNSAGKVR